MFLSQIVNQFYGTKSFIHIHRESEKSRDFYDFDQNDYVQISSFLPLKVQYTTNPALNSSRIYAGPKKKEIPYKLEYSNRNAVRFLRFSD